MEDLFGRRIRTLECATLVSVIVFFVLVAGEESSDNKGNHINSMDKVNVPKGMKQDKHGRVMMGVKQAGCDDGVTDLLNDWDIPEGKDPSYEYTCQPEEEENSDELFTDVEKVEEDCLDKSTIPRPGHACMSHKIVYEDTPPRAGNHRPLWPAWGEYLFLPQPRWVHALEHGAAVFLYHPCADPVGVQLMKLMAKSCMRKILITPYRKMKQQFAIVTYGCRLMMNSFDPEAAHDYIKAHALVDSPETTPKSGTFTAQLLEPAHIVPGSDLHDRCICPYWSSHRNSLEPYMSWYRKIETRVTEAKRDQAPVNLTGIFIGKDIPVEKTADGCPLS